ncbi:MAG: tetratricopeptide repeat protein [Candidatus Njordarchaeia archaeon]
MEYYYLISSINNLLGEEGYWRLPSYLPNEYVMDEEREIALNKAVEATVKGSNVLICGKPGTGKTAFMFIVLKKLVDMGYTVGLIREGVNFIGNDHVAQGVILFYDDLPRMNRSALESISKNKVRGLVATARSEELSELRRIMGEVLDTYEIIDLLTMDKRYLRQILVRFTSREGIKIIDESAVDVVCNKAQGLPVYIWQLVRELRIKKMDLTMDFAEKIPQGMFDYVDDILWRVLDEHEERYDVLLTLLIMSDMPRFALHQDLYNSVFVVSKERRVERRLELETALFSDLLDRITRYLSRESKTYSFRLPHDSWGDVLKGKSKGPMSGEISRINTAYPKEKRVEILKEAAKKAWNEALVRTDDEERKRAFLENLSGVILEEEIKSLLKEGGKEKAESVQISKETPYTPPTTEAGATRELEAKSTAYKGASAISGVDYVQKLIENPLLIDRESIRRLIKIASSETKETGIRELAVKALIGYWKKTKDMEIVPKIKNLLTSIGTSDSLYMLGSFNYLLKNYNEAREAFKAALELKGEEAALGLALTNLRLGNIENALFYLREYLKRHPEDREVQELLNKFEPIGVEEE